MKKPKKKKSLLAKYRDLNKRYNDLSSGPVERMGFVLKQGYTTSMDNSTPDSFYVCAKPEDIGYARILIVDGGVTVTNNSESLMYLLQAEVMPVAPPSEDGRDFEDLEE